MEERNSNMTMTYESISPEIAAKYLTKNVNNRHISKGTVTAYVNDILAGHWNEFVGSTISFDTDGVLRDGQHRLMAIVESGISVRMWVCRGVSKDGIYDNNRKRSTADQILIMKGDFEGAYRSPRYIAVARTIITRSGRRFVTPSEIIDFTERNKELLDGFFLNINQATVAKISLAVVYLGMFTAYCANVPIESLVQFYEILQTGMSESPEEFPIIAYRNYLKDYMGAPQTTDIELSRCQYAIKKYLTKSCTKRTIAPKELIYPFPKLN